MASLNWCPTLRRWAALRAPAGHADCGGRQEKSLTSGFVFTTRRGRPVSPYTLVKYWHDIREAAGLSTLRFHDLQAHPRVTAAGPRRTAAGRPGDRRAQRHQGHDDGYAHGNLTEKAAALTQLGEAISGGLLSPVVSTRRQTSR